MQRRAMLIAAVVLAVVAGVAVWLVPPARIADGTGPRPTGLATVADRLVRYGPAARERLRPYFAGVGATYPPGELVLVGIKDRNLLEVWVRRPDGAFVCVRAYPILRSSGRAGPKLRQGDLQVPEGLYRIESLNPNSKYHLSLRVSYPNEFDRQRAREEGRTNLGGDIMIHGGAASVGCLAMGDEAAEDLFVLAADTGLSNLQVILMPTDLRTAATVDVAGLPTWTADLYSQIQQRLTLLGLK